ncbi:hypothetical protein FRC05_008544 [Tulasnella sp. 425]|nr:hypothetical protein FRC05_008544 [Tulasnella sp. 425]
MYYPSADSFISSINWATLWTDPAPIPESGTRKTPPPPPRMSDVFDGDAGDEADVVEKEDPELQRVIQMYGGLSPSPKPSEVKKSQASPSMCPVVQEEGEDDSSKDEPLAPFGFGTQFGPLHHVLSPVAEEEPTTWIETFASPLPRQSNSGFVAARYRRTPPSIDPSRAAAASIPPVPGSALSPHKYCDYQQSQPPRSGVVHQGMARDAVLDGD